MHGVAKTPTPARAVRPMTQPIVARQPDRSTLREVIDRVTEIEHRLMAIRDTTKRVKFALLGAESSGPTGEHGGPSDALFPALFQITSSQQEVLLEIEADLAQIEEKVRP